MELEFSKGRDLAKFHGELCDLIFEKCEFFQRSKVSESRRQLREAIAMQVEGLEINKASELKRK